ncbi:hypothetical protein HaLaN_25793 [Haematococcus lacustris]|uniref:Uncharacterized protein n=1 Tax=Haematococcus lacustris TaxID=44745 RepID=A0A6A0A4P1_HAELA|nr:hypothetical protein HaLaN_25793 [Haematococcus lacustris]
MATKWAEGRPRFGSAHEEACRRGDRPAGRAQGNGAGVGTPAALTAPPSPRRSSNIAVGKLRLTGCRTIAGGSRPVYTHRRFFDGVMCKHDASFSPADCVKFMSALLEFDDHLDMLYRLTKPQETTAPGFGHHHRHTWPAARPRRGHHLRQPA